jgi:hypothetical protein
VVKFTVLGIYRDSLEIWTDEVDAPDVDLAVIYVADRLMKDLKWGPARKKDLLVVEVLKGDVNFALGQSHPIPADEFKGPRDWSPRKR